MIWPRGLNIPDYVPAYGGIKQQGTKVCRYSWHSAGFPGWPFPMLKYEYIFQIKYTEAI